MSKRWFVALLWLLGDDPRLVDSDLRSGREESADTESRPERAQHQPGRAERHDAERHEEEGSHARNHRLGVRGLGMGRG